MTKIAVLPSDGIDREIVAETVKVPKTLGKSFKMEFAPVGGAGYEAKGHPLSEDTLKLAKEADAILFDVVSDWKYDTLAREPRLEQTIPGLCKHLQLFASFHPAICYPELTGVSSLRPKIIAGLDIPIVRGLNGDIYSGQPRGVRAAPDGLFAGAREGFDTTHCAKPEIRHITHVAFQATAKRSKKLCSVDKANVFETSQFWRDIVTDIHKEYPEVELSHMYVDDAVMQLTKAPKNFDITVTGNISGNILSDEVAILTGSIGTLPPASLDANNKGLYEPSHGSTPDIAGKGTASPLATILSAIMILCYSLNKAEQADHIENTVKKVFAQGYRTGGILTSGRKQVGTVGMGDAVVVALQRNERYGAVTSGVAIVAFSVGTCYSALRVRQIVYIFANDLDHAPHPRTGHFRYPGYRRQGHRRARSCGTCRDSHDHQDRYQRNNLIDRPSCPFVFPARSHRATETGKITRGSQLWR